MKNKPSKTHFYRYMIEEYDIYLLKIFCKHCYPLKAPNAPKFQKIQKIDFKLENVSSDNTKP